MAYSESQANLEAFPGSSQANSIDEQFRKQALALRERFGTTLFTNFLLDPLVVRDEILGKLDNKILVIPHTDVIWATLTGVSITEQYTEVQQVTGIGIVGLRPLAVGVTIKQVEIMVEKLTGSIDYEIFKTTFSGTVTTKTPLVTPASVVTAGLQVIQSAVFSELTTGNEHYYLKLDCPGSLAVAAFRLYAIRVIYDCPGSQKTI